MANAFISEIYGESVAKNIANTLEYIPITNSSYDPFYALYNLTAKESYESFFQPFLKTQLQESPTSTLAVNATRNYGVIIYPGFVGLDAIGVLGYPEYAAAKNPINISIISHSLEPVATFGRPGNPSPLGQKWVPTHTFSNPPPIDVLIVPGLPTAGPFPHATELLKFITSVYPKVEHLVTVGTGSVLVAQAGLLAGRNATTSKSVWKEATTDRRVKWTTGRWVRDGNIWTASGAAAGLDVGNALSIELYGANTTQVAWTGMEYTPHSSSTEDPFAAVWGIHV